MELSTQTEQPTATGFATYWHMGVLAVCYYLTNQNVIASQYNVNLPIDFLADTAGSGSATRQIAFLILFLYGVFGIKRLLKSNPAIHTVAGLSTLALIAWMFCSVLWSPNLHESAARSFGLVAVILAALRLRTSMTPRAFIAGLTWVTTGYALFGLACELALGTFLPWQSEYRFAGTLHPNEQGINCSLAVLGAFWLFRTSSKRKLWLTIFIIDFAFAFLTKSRTATLSMAIAIMLFLAMTQMRRLRTVVIGAALATVVAGAAFLQINQIATGSASVSLGRDSSTSDDKTLTGRIPLWGELMEAVDQRPICGIGFGGFWTSANIEKYSKDQTWGISAAHSTYVDLLLSVGTVGLLIYLGAVLLSLVLAVQRWFQSKGVDSGYFGSLLLFVLFDGLTDSEPVIVSSLLCLCFFVTLFQVGVSVRPQPDFTLQELLAPQDLVAA